MGMGNIATSGMQAAMSEMSVISNNIANANTIGFKKSYASFQDVYPSGNGTSGPQIGLGVDLQAITQNFSAGGSRDTGFPSNMQITNSGFFILKDATTGQTTYSRDGSFGFDKDTGYFFNGNQNLQGFLAVNGTIPSGALPTDLKIDTSAMLPQATTKVYQKGVNLDSNVAPPAVTPFNPADTSTYNLTSSSKVYDSLGNANTINLYYVRPSAGATTWNVYAALSPSNTILNASAPVGNLTFNSSGVLTSSSTINLSFSPGGGAATPQSVSYDMTNITQNASNASSGQLLPLDGYAPGTFNTFTIDPDGVVTAIYAGNGLKKVVGQVALANFTSPESLQYMGKSNWNATTDSGVPIISPNNSKSAIKANAIELSNVDMATELVGLINAQSTFQANAQVEQTYNQVMQTVTKL